MLEIKKNHQYSIDYDIEGDYDCSNHGCHDICRCYSITEVKINNVSLTTIALDIFNDVFQTKTKQYKRDNKLNKILFGYDSDVELYCIDRILRSYKLYEPDKWEPDWGAGYYGDELHSINIVSSVYQKISTSISDVITMGTLKEKVEFILKLEYGFLLDSLKEKNYKVETVKKEDIIFGQKEYHKKINRGLDYYSDQKYDLIRGICLLSDDKYRVIDGYHRLSETKKQNVKIIVAYD